ncbi:MAG: phosphatidylserine decarboxylase [Leptospirales bacterium]|nr:phosphatidylserine decarboxylase [Leptospirales bacterium]
MISETYQQIAIPLVSFTILVGVFLTIRFRLVQFLKFPLAIKVASGMLDQPPGPQTLTQFQALALSLSASAAVGAVIYMSMFGRGVLLWFFAFSWILAAIQYGATVSLHARSRASKLSRSIILLAVLALCVQGFSQGVSFAGIQTGLTGGRMPIWVVLVSALAGLIGLSGLRTAGTLASILAGFAALLLLLAWFWHGSEEGIFSRIWTGFTNPGDPAAIAAGLLFALTLSEIAKTPFLFSAVRTEPAKAGLTALLSAILAPIVAFLSAAIAHRIGGSTDTATDLYRTALFFLTALWVLSWVISLQIALPASGRIVTIVYVLLLPVSILFPATPAILTMGLWSGLLLIVLLPVLAVTGSGIAARELDDLSVSHQWEISKDIYLIFLTILPQNLLSRMFGWIASTPLPRAVREPVLMAYSRAFGVTVEEAAKEIKEYGSLNLFFIRNLKPGARPIEGNEKTIVSPVDGTVLRFGDITDGKLIQAKAIHYSLEDLLDAPEYLERFQGGRFLVIYLSPRDYHRIHFPVAGEVPGFTYLPGDLFTVNPIAVNRLHALFPKNERLTTYIHNPNGWLALIKVGATNVGRIYLEYDRFVTNRWIRTRKDQKYATPLQAKRGDELGRFEMGSTVVLLFEKDTMKFLPLVAEENKVKFGQAIGLWK